MTVFMVTFICSNMAILGLSAFIIVSQQQQRDRERKEWLAERKDLLDRIQAPTFNDYANKVVREKKAEQPKEEEKPIQYVT